MVKKNERVVGLKLLNNIFNLYFESIHRNAKITQRDLKVKLPTTKPQELLFYFCPEISFSGEIELKAIKLIDILNIKMNFGGRSPSGIASAVLYYVSLFKNERSSQKKQNEKGF